MFFDVCLRLWSFLAQAPSPAAEAAASPAAAVQPPPLPASSGALGIFQYILMALYLLVCVGLVAAVLSQTSKNEGLSGMLGGGSTQSVFRGKKSFEESLSTITNYLAVGFIVLSMLISVFLGKS